ncbi:MAG: hydrolase [Pirellulaceae bacterium]|nr:MAG: hydrolase [Pirellulaceae bacterium]
MSDLSVAVGHGLRPKFAKRPLFVPVEVPELRDAKDAMLAAIGIRMPAWRILSSTTQLLWVESSLVQTAATDGWYVYWNPGFFASLSPPERVGVWAHEVSHIIRQHVPRSRGLNVRKWNVATDYVINGILKNLGLSLPGWVLYDEKYDGWTEYEVYRALPDQSSDGGEGSGGKGSGGKGSDGGGDGSGDGGWNPDAGLTEAQKKAIEDALSGAGAGDLIPDPTVSESQFAERSQSIASAVQRAAAAARLAGTGLSGLEGLMDIEPKSDYRLRKWLDQFVTASMPDVVSWGRLDRRMYAQGIAWPGVMYGGYAPLGVAIDTSGSMSEKEIKLALEAVKGTFDSSTYSHLVVVWFAGEVWRVDEFSHGETIELPDEIISGGTSFQAAFNELDDHSVNARIIFTDGGDIPPPDPMCPVLWVYPTHNHGMKPSYGDKLELRGVLSS